MSLNFNYTTLPNFTSYSQLGYSNSNYINGLAVGITIPTTYTFTNVPVGIYLFNFTAQMINSSSGGTFGYSFMQIYGSDGTVYDQIWMPPPFTTGNNDYGSSGNMSCIVSNSISNNTFTFSVVLDSGSAVITGYISLTRIG